MHTIKCLLLGNAIQVWLYAFENPSTTNQTFGFENNIQKLSQQALFTWKCFP